MPKDNLTKAGQAAYAELEELIEATDSDLDEELVEYGRLKEESDRLLGRLELYKDRQLRRVIELGTDKLDLPMALVTLNDGRVTEFVDAKKLIEHGVSVDTIKECTVRRQGSAYVVIRPRKQEGGE